MTNLAESRNARAMRAAQEMYDRATPEPDAFDSWYYSIEGDHWFHETAEQVVAGKPVYTGKPYAIAPMAVMDRIEDARHSGGPLSRQAADALDDWRDAVLRHYITESDDDRRLMQARGDELRQHLERIAEGMVEAIAYDYYGDYVAGGA